ncbi:LAME_0B00386g1_1 [Lachancea meyersii CBS 8951]|uniref:LAME_0B00386g1_1 n=1 Tax=Lachancea meyersii CBS 8951 TaxID=1266667 RepID=A0A1G4ISI1_9SACH|nr:LAME_0B00386g1_1 [Lachancea meyersii CBS 8951]
MLGFTQCTNTTERYALASKARSKLLSCAAQSKKKELNLRVLVGHANLLDRVMETIHNSEDNSGDEEEEEEGLHEEAEEGELDYDQMDEPVVLVGGRSEESSPNYITGPPHVTFTLPAAPQHTIYEYNSDSDSETESESDSEIENENFSDDSSDYDDYGIYNDSETELKRLRAKNSDYLRRPATYTLAHDENMTKPSSGDLLLVSIPEENEEGEEMNESAPRQLAVV